MSAPGKHKACFLERLSDARELERAWLDVLSHYPKDRIPAELREFDRRRGAELARVAAELQSGAFLPEPSSLIFIPKPNHPDERRPIALIRPEDRIVLTLLNRILLPLFERQFLPFSFAYRPGKGAWPAIERVSKCLAQGKRQTASGDIDDFFGNIDRERLLRDIRRSVFEQRVVDLLETYLHIGVARDFEWKDSGRGISQGSPLSPLLSNIALAGFDRFADNFILFGNDPAQVKDAFARAEAFLLESCGLALNADSRVFA
jgi:RNA-directed DNA polymerase